MPDEATRRCDIAGLGPRTLAVVMAGGSGSRLGPLTRWHAKPALPFGGQYRNIDFTLSNCLNSGIRRMAILTQYKAHSLIQHVCRGWTLLDPDIDEFVEVWPAQQRAGDGWYAGTADAIYQNLDLIASHGADYVVVLAGDHIYQMDYLRMVKAHADSGADLTVGCVEVPVGDASSFGVMAVEPSGWVSRFDEKPRAPQPLPNDADRALASMGIYVFDRKRLFDCLSADAALVGSRHDFGHDIVPRMIRAGSVLAYPLRHPRGGPGYWRDVGTLEQYWLAHMELLGDAPRLDLHDQSWPIRTHAVQGPPARFVADGFAQRSIVSAGCSVGGHIDRSVLSRNSRVQCGAVIEESVLLPDVEIGAGSRIRRAVVDSGCVIPAGTTIDGEEVTGSTNGVALVTAEHLEGAFGPRSVLRASDEGLLQTRVAGARH